MKESYTDLYRTPELGARVSEYSEAHSTPLPSRITNYHAANTEHEDSNMLSSNFQSQFHLVLARGIGAKRVLEIGVFLGYSALVWSHAVGPEGLVTGLEFDAGFAKTAKAALADQGADNVEIIVGPAAETLKQLDAAQPYDLVFIDADKDGYVGYLRHLLNASQPGSQNRLLRPGALILADNTLRRGFVADDSLMSEEDRAGYRGKLVTAVQEFNRVCVAEPRLQTFLMPLWDGLSVMTVLD
jgi:predicted O-methyltransferase YrrM